MRIADHEFTAGLIGRIRARVESEPDLSRRELSRQVCLWEDWRSPNGKLKTQSCRKALGLIHKRQLITLPEVEVPAAFRRRRGQPSALEPGIVEITCELPELGEIEVIPVLEGSRALSRAWNGMMDEYHPRARGPLCGAQLRYLVKCDKGWLGGLSFSAAAWRLGERDRVIGWSDAARRANLGRVVNNSRFLILPTVRVRNLASHVLGQCVKRLPEDWHKRYRIRPVLVETFVDEEHRGTCYRAANWWKVGQTASRSRPFANGKVPDGKKEIYLFALEQNWQEELCREPEVVLGAPDPAEEPENWAEAELGTVRLGDERLRRRLFGLTLAFYHKPHSLIAAVCDGNYGQTKAAYRFLSHRSTSMNVVLTPHKESTIQRMKEHRVVLAVQDTTVLNYTAHPPEDAGPVTTKRNEARGFLLHDTMAFTEQGLPLGVLDAQFWARDPATAGKGRTRRARKIEEKESIKWLKSYRAATAAQALCPETRVVSTGDREADVYELFAEARRTPGGAKLLVRADKGRKRMVAGGAEGGQRFELERLWDRLQRRAPAGELEVNLPRRRNRSARSAHLIVRHDKVTLRPPQRRQTLGPIELWAVHVKETGHGPEVAEPLEWMLLTDVETESFEDACVRIKWYGLRWGVEVFHRTLKSCCRVLDRRLEDGQRLETCLALDMVVAWRVYWSLKLGRELPDLPCSIFLDRSEWVGLWAYFYRRKPPPTQPPPCKEAMVLIAKLGGFLGRKADRFPGILHMTNGFQRLGDISWTFADARGHPP